jgi:hypothetical protein
MRLTIAQGLVAMLQGVQNPNTSSALFALVKLGHVFDPSAYATGWCEVSFSQAKSGPAGSGGNLVGWRIEDNPVFAITSGWPYDTDSTAAETNMLTAMDILMPILHSHYQIPAPNNPTQPIATVYSLLEDQQPEQARVVRYANGKVYILWKTYVLVKQQYSVLLVNP